MHPVLCRLMLMAPWEQLGMQQLCCANIQYVTFAPLVTVLHNQSAEHPDCLCRSAETLLVLMLTRQHMPLQREFCMM